MLCRLVRNVILVIYGRMTFLVGIDTEDAEVTCVAGPHPVVGVATELADVARRAAHETDIGVDLVEKHIIFITQEERLDADLIRGFFLDLGDKSLHILIDFGLTLVFRHIRGDIEEHLLGHITHLAKEDDAESGTRKFLSPVHRPESVGEIVMLDGAMFLDIVVAAVVVSKQQALVADDFSRAAAAKEHDGVFQAAVFQAAVVDAVNVISGDFHAHLLHLFFVVLQQHGDPHAFTSKEEGGEKDQKGRQKMESFHNKMIKNVETRRAASLLI